MMNRKGTRDFEWPSNYKATVCFTWDVDGESAQYFRNPDQAKNQTSELVQRSYGPEVGIWKILDLLDKYSLKATFYVPGYTANLHPETTNAIVERRHAIGIHGYMHETMDNLTEEQEREMFRLSIQSLRKYTNFTPRIFRSPSFELNRRTPGLLLENGIVSDSSLMGDDFPYVIDVPAGNLIELPVQWILDDFEFWGHTKSNRQKSIIDPTTTLNTWIKEFEGIYKSGGIFVLTMHPFVSGRWTYIDVIERLIRYILGFPEVWVASVEQVTNYCLEALHAPYMVHRELPSPVPIDFKV